MPLGHSALVPAHCCSTALHWPARDPLGSRVPIGRGCPTPGEGAEEEERDWWSRDPRVAAARCVPTMAAPMPPTASWAPAGVPRGYRRGRLRRRLSLPACVRPGAASPLPSSPLR